jgi:TonB family protein
MLSLLTASPLIHAEDSILNRAPEAVEKVHAEFPKTMVTYLTLGYVVIELTVDTDGRPRAPVVNFCNHFEFEAPAIEAALKWRFRPALQHGRPVEATCRVTLTFSYKPGVGTYSVNATMPFEVPPQSPPGYTPELSYDQPPKLVHMTKAVFPRSLLEKNARGYATLVFLIDPSGRPRRIQVTKATHPEFGESAAAMMASWRFNPAGKNGKPTWTSLSYKQMFTNNDRDSPANPDIKRLLKELKSKQPDILPDVSLLDERPVALYRVHPEIPDQLAKSGEAAAATIECILDRRGHIQLPQVMSASHAEFGWSAATAAARWLFQPPTRGGQPVDVVVRIPFERPAVASQMPTAKTSR